MEMTINHSSHLIPQQVGQFQSGQRGGPATNLGYTDSYSNIKYESLDGSDNHSVGNEFIGNGQHSSKFYRFQRKISLYFWNLYFKMIIIL